MYVRLAGVTFDISFCQMNPGVSWLNAPEVNRCLNWYIFTQSLPLINNRAIAWNVYHFGFDMHNLLLYIVCVIKKCHSDHCIKK